MKRKHKNMFKMGYIIAMAINGYAAYLNYANGNYLRTFVTLVFVLCGLGGYLYYRK